MKQFFGNIQAFREALLSRRNTPDRCWACAAHDCPLTDLNIHKDFESFGVPSEGCDARITLCPDCAVRYMNSFNLGMPREGPVKLWTVEEFLELCSGAPGEPVWEDEGPAWYEFPVEGLDEDEAPVDVRARLQALLDIATRLDGADCPTCLTMTGLAFQPPMWDEDEVADFLATLGISEAFNPYSGRTLAEVYEVLDDVRDRVRYGRMRDYLNEAGPDRSVTPGAIHGVLDEMRQLEDRYGEEMRAVEDDYVWGSLSGIQSALHWLFGHEWGCTGT